MAKRRGMTLPLERPDWLESVGPTDGWGEGVRAQLSVKPANLGLSVGDDPAEVWRRREAFEAALGGRCQWLDQVHGITVVGLRHALGSVRHLPQADAVWTDQLGVGCVAQAADCLPLLAAQADRVGAAHAGWRGLCAGVALELLKAMVRPGEGALRLSLGPCIGPRAFEVGEEVAQQFVNQWGASCPGIIWPDSSHLHRPAGAEFHKPHLDLQAIATWQIENWCGEQNISLIWIEIDKRCTVEDDRRLFSHRRVQNAHPSPSSTPEKPGRMAAGIIRMSA